MWSYIFASTAIICAGLTNAKPVIQGPTQAPTRKHSFPQGKLLQALGRATDLNEPWKLCDDSSLKADYDPEPFFNGDAWSCVRVANEEIDYLGIEMDFENVRPAVNATVDENDLFSALRMGAQAMRDEAKARPPLVPPGPTVSHPDVNVTLGEAAWYFEGFPCTGEESMSIIRLPIEQIKWLEISYALEAILALLKVRSVQGRRNNVGVGRIIRVRDPMDSESWSDLGGFNIQNIKEPRHRLTELFPSTYSCYGKPQRKPSSKAISVDWPVPVD